MTTESVTGGGTGCQTEMVRLFDSLARLYTMSEAPASAVLEYALGEALSLTGSGIGFIYGYNEDTRLFELQSWSRGVMESCGVSGQSAMSELENTGIWGEVVRQRKPFVLNDYAAPHPLKKGYPQGHTPLKNFMSVPVFRGKAIAAVVGVANKEGDYSQADVDALSLFSHAVWTAVSLKRIGEEMAADRTMVQFRHIANEIPLPLCLSDASGHYVLCNNALLEFLGVRAEHMAGKTAHDMFDPQEAAKLDDYTRDILRGKAREPVLTSIVARGGERRTVLINRTVHRDREGKTLGFVGTLIDVTESKKLEQALAAEAEFNTRLLEHAPVGIAVYNAATGECVKANRFLADLIGGDVEALKKQNFRQLASWRDSGLLELAERALAGREVVKADRRFVSTFGREVFLDCTFSAMDAGGSSYLLLVGKDISGHKRMEAELKDQLAFIRTLADAIPSPVYFKDTSGRYVWCNKAYKELRGGLDPVGKTVFELLGPEAAAFHLEKETGMYARGAPIAYEYETFSSAGEVREVIFHKAPVSGSDGGVKGLIGVMTDITDRKRAEANLRESEEALRRILLGVQAGIVIIDPEEFAVVDLNPIAERILGLSRQELIGKPCTAVKWVRERDGSVEVVCPLLEGNIVNEEFRVERPDGTSVPVLKTVVSAMRGGRLLFYEILFDMTARRAMERQLALAQRLESIGGLAAGIAHEINTPVQYIGDNMSFLEGAFSSLAGAMRDAREKGAVTGDGDDLDFILEETPKALSQSREGLARVAEIVRAMKRFSHPGMEEKSLLDVPKAIENTVLVSRNEWKYHAEIRLDLDPAAEYLPCYPGDFTQALLNILVNASHAISDKYKDSEDKGIITIRTRLEKGQYVLSVSDTGCGIPEKNLHRVFDPFFTTKEVGKGTGQGLALVHDVMRKHGGTVGVESALGQGTTFFLRFPMPTEEGAKA